MTKSNPDASGPSLWGRLAGSTAQELPRTWLALQCTLVPAVRQGVLVLRGGDEGPFAPVAAWPEEHADPERLVEVADRAIKQSCGLVAELPPRPGSDATVAPGFGLAYPILVDGDLKGVVALEVAPDSEATLTLAMQELQWGTAWMELHFRRGQRTDDRKVLARLKSAVDLLAAVLAEERFERAAMVFVTELANELRCDRVSLGALRGSHVKVQAISHSAQVGTSSSLDRALVAAMEEAVVQRCDLVFPPASAADVRIVRDHERLSQSHGARSILTLAMCRRDRYVGAITFERAVDAPFDEDDVRFCRSVAALVDPALEEKRANDRLVIVKVLLSAWTQTGRLLGPGYLGRKLVALLTVVLVAFFWRATWEYRLSADTVIEGAVRRALVAPFDGYVNDAPVRAGDRVRKGTAVCVLDDRDLRLERLKYHSQRTQLERQFQEAAAGHDKAKASIIAAQLDQTKAQLSLVEAQLARTLIVAPFDGLLTSGDLSQRLGSAVKQGDVLFEIAPLDAYRVILEVDERRIADVREGQRGTLVLSSLPNEHYPFVISKITPISTAKEGRNYYRVEARLERVSERLRPGMEGIGKVSIDRRLLVSIWTRDLVEWVRLTVWAWRP